jgi:hypothetical protein
MIRKNVLLFVCCSGLIGLGLVGLAQQSEEVPATPKATEAPAGFKTPTLSNLYGPDSLRCRRLLGAGLCEANTASARSGLTWVQNSQ